MNPRVLACEGQYIIRAIHTTPTNQFFYVEDLLSLLLERINIFVTNSFYYSPSYSALIQSANERLRRRGMLV